MIKKVLLIFAVLLFSNSACMAFELDSTKEGQYQKKVMEIGFNLLNTNRIEKRTIFKYKDDSWSKEVNAYASSLDKSVTVLKGLMPYLENDAELAGVLAHEIAHQQDFYKGYFRMLAMAFTPKKYEQKADKIAVDYMVKAGYNPVAIIIVLNKILGQTTSDYGASHPMATKRLAYIYEYLYKKYPAYLVDNEYKDNVYYQNFLLTSKDARKKIREDIEKQEKQGKEIPVSNTKK